MAESDDELRMSFTEHLAELRIRIIRSLVAVFVGVVLCLIAYNPLFSVVTRPLRVLQDTGIVKIAQEAAPASAQAPAAGTAEEASRHIQMVVLNPLEPFLVQVKLATVAGVAIALPFVIFQLCAFIFPGLKPNERRAAAFLIVGSSVLVLIGVSIAYFGVFPYVLPYLANWAPPGVSITLRMNETVSLILKGLLGFAIAFQFPMLVLVLVFLGVLDPMTLRRHRRVVLVIILVLAGILTPPDPFSLFFLFLPLSLMYEASIWGSYLLLWRRRRAEASTELEDPNHVR